MSQSNVFTSIDLAGMFPHFQTTLLRVDWLVATYSAVNASGEYYLLRVLLPHNMGDPNMLLCFKHEVKASTLLSDRGFLKYYSSGEAMGVPYMCSEYYDGYPLPEAYAGVTMSFEDACYITSRVCESLQYLHSRGMTHFDINPNNIWVNTRGHVKVLQLGQARFNEPNIVYPSIYGTVGYIAPEVTSEGWRITPLCDVYACGSLLFELITGINPSTTTQKASILTGCSEAYDHLIVRCRADSPSNRIQSIELLVSELQGITNGAKVLGLNSVDTTIGSVPHTNLPKSLVSNNSTSKSSIRPIIALAGVFLVCLTWYYYTFEWDANDSKEEDIVTVLPGYTENPRVSKEEQNNRIQKADESVIKETIDGVRFFLILPKGEVRGVLVDIPWDFDQDSMASQFVKFRYVRKAVELGYAVLGWESPARKWTEGSDYGVDEHELTVREAENRRRKWQKWIPKIDEGISKMALKHNLPSNGFVARVDCLSAARISRYVAVHPERFSAIVYDKPHGLNEPSIAGKHILTVLISPRDTYYYPSGLHFFQRAKQIGYPIMFQAMQEYADFKKNDAVDLMFYYIFAVREELHLSGTMEGTQVEQLAIRFRQDMEKAKYFQDCINGGIHTVGEADWVPEEQKVYIPRESLVSMWERGKLSEDTSTTETLNRYKPGKYTKLTEGAFSVHSVKGAIFEIHRKHTGNNTIHLLGGNEQEIEVKFENLENASFFSFKAERWTSTVPLRFRVQVYANKKWVEVYVGDRDVKTGNLPTTVTIQLPKGCKKVRIQSSAKKGGTQVDDFMLW